MTLAQNEPITQETGVFNELPVAAAATIYEGAVCTLNSSGYVPDGGFSAGQPFVGHAWAKVDNSAGAAGGKRVSLLSGIYRLVVSLACSIEDVGRPVFASANDTYTLDPGSATAAYTQVGKVHRYVSATKAAVEFSTLPVAVSENTGVWMDDFLGYQLFTTQTGSAGPWVGSVVGDATVAAGADIHGGAAVLTIAATSEAEDANFYFGDQLGFDVNLLEEFSCRFKVATPGTGVKVVIGMAGDHNADKDTIAQSAWFSLDAGLDLKAETDDGTTNNDDKAISTILTNTWYEGRIDFRDLTDVKFFLDGAQVATDTTFDISAYAGGLQPYASADKASGTGTGVLTIDYMKVKFRRGA